MYCSYIPLLSQAEVSHPADGTAAKPLTPFENDALRMPALRTFEGALAVIRTVRLDTNNRHLVAAHRTWFDGQRSNWGETGHGSGKYCGSKDHLIAADRPYRSGRSPDRIKVKNPDVPASTQVIEG
jgi:hypothetical protein